MIGIFTSKQPSSKKMKNNEEYTISTDTEKINVKANQLFFGSEEKQVASGRQLEVHLILK